MSALLCQKFGGLIDPSPKRPPPPNLKACSKSSIKPGAPIPRSGSQRHRRTLERVLTDDKSRHRRQAPTLARSATEPVLHVKREVRDTSLSTIPLNKVPISKRYTQREVDLQAASQTNVSKQKKKINLEQELQGAIAAIKRPDPKMAGREFVETVERRQAGAYPQSRLRFVLLVDTIVDAIGKAKIRFVTRLHNICKSWPLLVKRNVPYRLSYHRCRRHDLSAPVRPTIFLQVYRT